MDRVAVDLGFIQIYWYSICIFVAIVIACTLIFREAKRRGVDEDFLVNLAFNTVIFGIIGARLYYVAFNFQYYLAHPIEIIEIWNGGLAIHGGLLAGFLSVLTYCKKNEVSTLRIIDMIVVGLIIAQSIGRWGNFFNKEAYGAVTTLASLKIFPQFIIDGMYIMGEYHQPTFLYESIGCFIGFIALLFIRKNENIKIGTLTSAYMIWYGILRFIIEAMRTDSLMLGPIKMAQIVSVLLIITGVGILINNSKKREDIRNYYRTDPKQLAIEQLVYFN